jgi:DNA replication protein
MAKPMTGFVGFPDSKMKQVIVPDFFFTDLLPQIDDLAELKVTLHCIWLLNEKTGEYRYLRGDELREDATLLAGLALESDLRTPSEVLKDALQRCVARNTLLRLEITTVSEEVTADGKPVEDTHEDWYFLNTAKGRQAVAMIRQGRLNELRAAMPAEARLKVERPNIFIQYEQNINLLTPLIAEQLRDMERTYPPEWINEAFEIAVSRNRRNLRYIQTILKRWETEGKDGDRYEETGRDSEEGRRKKYIPDEYSDIILG